MKDHSKENYFEAVFYREPFRGYGWKVYHYDVEGSRQIILGKSEGIIFQWSHEAEEVAEEWCHQNNIKASHGYTPYG